MKRLLLSLALLAAGCTVGISDADPIPVVGGSYGYSVYRGGTGDLVMQGTLILEDGADGEIGGAYILPGQCSTEDGETADCRGAVRGTVGVGGEVRFDFDDGTFHHTGALHRDGSIEGLWIYHSDSTTETGEDVHITGRFEATPSR